MRNMNIRSIGIAFLVLISVALALGCVDNETQTQVSTEQVQNQVSTGPISATWIEPEVNGDTVLIPVETIDENINSHFKLDTEVGQIAVMAFTLEDEIIVRSNVCPPCGSIGFALDNGILVCDACRTTFDAVTGSGIRGACVDYPKENIQYTEEGGNIVMNMDDIVTAHLNTVQRG